MSDHPILFSAPMVRALIDGRKTLTRRVLGKARVFATPDRPAWTLRGEELARALQNASDFRRMEGNGWFWEADAFPWQAPATRTRWLAHLGYARGDRLWVREQCATWGRGSDRAPVGYPVAYAADDPEWEDIKHDAKVSSGDEWKIRPSIHMPRWASRLTLTVTDVRVERLQDISEADAIAEGVERDSDGWRDYLMPQTQCCATAKDSFRTLWGSINGPGAWEANPWVTVTSFETHCQNIGQMEAA